MTDHVLLLAAPTFPVVAETPVPPAPIILPPALTPADCDLRDFPFIPLDVKRLRDSDMALTESPEACWAAVLLWSASWHQVPAASLPDDDRILSNLAGYGRVVRVWRKVKEGALHGWIKCADGRLYHKTVAEKANDAWHSKLQNHYGRMCERLRKVNKSRDDRKLSAIALPTFERWMESGRSDPEGQENAAPEVSVAVAMPKNNLPPEDAQLSAGIPPENVLKGEGEGEGEGEEEKSASQLAMPAQVGKRKDRTVTLTRYIKNCSDAGVKPVPANHHIRQYCRDAGISDDMVAIAGYGFVKNIQLVAEKRNATSIGPRHLPTA